MVATAAGGDVPGGVAGAVLTFNAILGGTATGVSGIMDLSGAATNESTSETDAGLKAVGSAGGLVTSVASGGNMQAGETGTTLTNAASLAASPKDAFRNAFTLTDAIGTAAELWRNVSNYITVPTAPPIPAPPPVPDGWSQ